jgi:hypothetical protein
MWQRIQTVFMVIVVISLLLAPFFSIWQKTNPSTQEMALFSYSSLSHSKSDQVLASTPTVYLWVLVWAAAAVSAYSITRFKSRLRQIQLNFLSTILIGVVLATNTYLMLFKGEVLFDDPKQGSIGVGFFLPIAAMLFNSLANRFIHRDEKLVRSADRLR